MIALRYSLLVFAGVCGGVVATTGVVNGVAILGAGALVGAVVTSRSVRDWALADPRDPRTPAEQAAVRRTATPHVEPSSRLDCLDGRCDCPAVHSGARRR